jgi:hypothetical protein
LKTKGERLRDRGLRFDPVLLSDGFEENSEFVFHTEVRRVKVDIDEAKKMVRDAAETLDGEIPEHDEDCDYVDWSPEGFS